jgi:2,4-dienoyl-CoA reductase-like NADH-dependent reductase (Old Yellow Enzyme family)
MTTPRLFQSLTIRGVVMPNRIVLAPMCQYSAKDGFANDWHLVHLGRFAMGGFGCVMAEATAVEPEGRITHGDLGLWNDAQIAPLKQTSDFIRNRGAVPAIQIAHAGRKASMQRPWNGNGPLNESDLARGDQPWEIKAPSAIAVDAGYILPEELSKADIEQLVIRFGEATARADAAGFDVVETHGAHGYLIASFLSPITNQRHDSYGGDRAGRMRFALEVARSMREKLPSHKALFFRVSSVDGAENGWSMADTVVLAAELRSIGVDVIDCSSGGLTGSSTTQNTKRGLGYQAPFAKETRSVAGIPTMAVGLILDGPQAEKLLEERSADLIAIGREALKNPHWGHDAAQSLGFDHDFGLWPEQSGWWLDKRAKAMNR